MTSNSACFSVTDESEIDWNANRDSNAKLYDLFTFEIEQNFQEKGGCLMFFLFLQNNLKTTLVWVIGFSSNFIIGNFLYVLLLLYCTNRSKARQLWGRWLIESVFNVVKDLYYIWVGVSFLDNLIHSINVGREQT